MDATDLAGGVVTPRSNCRSLPRNRKYCRTRGSFRPLSWRYCCLASSLAPSPRAELAWSPGAACRTRKTSNVMPRIINGNAASLRPSRRNIVTNLFSGWLWCCWLRGLLCGLFGGFRPQSGPRNAKGCLGGASDVDERQAGGGKGLEAVELLLIPGAGELAVEDRVERHFIGDQVHDFADDLLGLVTGRPGEPLFMSSCSLVRSGVVQKARLSIQVAPE